MAHPAACETGPGAQPRPGDIQKSCGADRAGRNGQGWYLRRPPPPTRGMSCGVNLPPAKSMRWSGEARGMHGVTLSDHGEKVTWPGYWEERERKLAAQPIDDELYRQLSLRLGSNGASSSTTTFTPSRGSTHDAEELSTTSLPPIFSGCRLYFDGRVDDVDGLSGTALGKLARLHGAEVLPLLTKRRVTHVVCTQLSGTKERNALESTATRGVSAYYFVHPQWITESIKARKRQIESRFSLVAQIARGSGFQPLKLAMRPALAAPSVTSTCETDSATAAPQVRAIQRSSACDGQNVHGMSAATHTAQPYVQSDILISVDSSQSTQGSGAADPTIVVNSQASGEKAAMTQLDSDEEQEMDEVILRSSGLAPPGANTSWLREVMGVALPWSSAGSGEHHEARE